MAFGSVYGVAVRNSKSSSSTLVITLSGGTDGDLLAGDMGLLWIASDNIRTTDNDGSGAPSDVVSVTDSRGNTWVVQYECCNSRGSAGGGATFTFAWCKCATSLQASLGDSITITFNGSITAKAVIALGLPQSGAYGVSFAGGTAADGAQANGDGADPAAISYDSGDTAAKFWVHGIGYEGDAGDGWTCDTDLTDGGIEGTTGGGAAGNMSVMAGYKANSTQTLNIDASTGASRDHTQGLFVIRENAAPAAAGGRMTLVGVGP